MYSERQGTWGRAETYTSRAADFASWAIIVVVALRLRQAQSRSSENSCNKYVEFYNHLHKDKLNLCQPVIVD